MPECSLFSKVYSQQYIPDKKALANSKNCRKIIYEVPVELEMENSNFNIDIMEEKMPELGKDLDDD